MGPLKNPDPRNKLDPCVDILKNLVKLEFVVDESVWHTANYREQISMARST